MAYMRVRGLQLWWIYWSSNCTRCLRLLFMSSDGWQAHLVLLGPVHLMLNILLCRKASVKVRMSTRVKAGSVATEDDVKLQACMDMPLSSPGSPSWLCFRKVALQWVEL
eukprot:547141-Pelagomonas_calceolata.AAC.2